MLWNKSLSDLQFHLAELFPLKEDIIHLAGKAGLPLSNLTVSDKGIVFWYHVLIEARQRGLLDELLDEALRLYPHDEMLKASNAQLVNDDHELRPEVLKELCADIIREGQFRSSFPLVNELISVSGQEKLLEVEMVVRFAETYRHLTDSELRQGRAKSRSLKYLESSKSDLIALIHAL